LEPSTQGWHFAQPIQLLLLSYFSFENPTSTCFFSGWNRNHLLLLLLPPFSTQVQVAASVLFQFPNACPALVKKEPCSVLNCAEIFAELITGARTATPRGARRPSRCSAPTRTRRSSTSSTSARTPAASTRRYNKVRRPLPRSRRTHTAIYRT
jgi:hypothetical protein